MQQLAATLTWLKIETNRVVDCWKKINVDPFGMRNRKQLDEIRIDALSLT